jgi:hypothetical protein
VAVEAVDFRRGIDGLARLCREVLRADPFSGAARIAAEEQHLQLMGRAAVPLSPPPPTAVRGIFLDPEDPSARNPRNPVP